MLVQDEEKEARGDRPQNWRHWPTGDKNCGEPGGKGEKWFWLNSTMNFPVTLCLSAAAETRHCWARGHEKEREKELTAPEKFPPPSPPARTTATAATTSPTHVPVMCLSAVKAEVMTVTVLCWAMHCQGVMGRVVWCAVQR